MIEDRYDIVGAGPCAIAIFGAAGDPTRLLLMPVLYDPAVAKSAEAVT